ncbi:hypothetical protein CMI41_03305 [Candidatus Pacearchaeota archaeon]|nr:hypothetical protein [Candidatus Pacearchaeota archaeon]
MKNEEYLRQLESQNGTCACPELQDLYASRDHAEQAKKQCDATRDESDLEQLSESDLEFLGSQKRQLDNLKDAAQRYHECLDRDAREGVVDLFRYTGHNKKNLVSYRTAKRLLRGKAPLITANCATCDQQIDILEAI